MRMLMIEAWASERPRARKPEGAPGPRGGTMSARLDEAGRAWCGGSCASWRFSWLSAVRRLNRDEPGRYTAMGAPECPRSASCAVARRGPFPCGSTRLPRAHPWHRAARSSRPTTCGTGRLGPAEAPKSKVWKRASHAGSTDLHPDFGPPSYGIPYDVVGAAHDHVTVDFGYADESDAGPYPFGPDIAVEGGSDRHALMVDGTLACSTSSSTPVERGDPAAGSGAIFDLGSNDLRPAGWTAPTPRVCRSSRGSCAATRCGRRIDHAIR